MTRQSSWRELQVVSADASRELCSSGEPAYNRLFAAALRETSLRSQELGVTIASIDLSSTSQMTTACKCASCVVSALQGLRDVIVETQTVLFDAAIKADVPRFIPSDYSIVDCRPQIHRVHRVFPPFRELFPVINHNVPFA